MYRRYTNFGICGYSRSLTSAKTCLANEARCSFGYCVVHCYKIHEYWTAHVMADGLQSPIDLRYSREACGNPAIATGSTPIAPPKPEPGSIEELTEESETFVPMPDNSRITMGKSGFPVKYVS